MRRCPSLRAVDLVFSLHGRVAYALVLYYTLVGLWGIVQGIRDRGPNASYRGAIAIAVVGAPACASRSG